MDFTVEEISKYFEEFYINGFKIHKDSEFVKILGIQEKFKTGNEGLQKVTKLKTGSILTGPCFNVALCYPRLFLTDKFILVWSVNQNIMWFRLKYAFYD